MPAASRRKSAPSRFAAGFAFALLVHGAALYVVAALGGFNLLLGKAASTSPSSSAMRPDRNMGEGLPLEVRTIDQPETERDLDKLMEALRSTDEPTPEEKKQAEEEKKREDEKHPEGQVVDIERPAIETRPDQAKFLAEYDSRVARETKGQVGRDKAGSRDEIKGGPESHLPSPSRVPEGSPLSRPGLPGPRRATKNDAAAGLRGENGAALEVGSDGQDARPGAPGVPGQSVRPQLGEGGVPLAPGQQRPNLQPSQEMLARALTRGGGAPDYLGDLDDGESTALNAKKFKFASFFNRVKRDVAREWNPSVVYVKHDPSGHIYGVKDRITVVRVHLAPDGKVANLTLRESSGADFLDEEAMDAFRRAAPFVHPPPELVDDDGFIHFNFGFIFELSGHTATRVLRYQ